MELILIRHGEPDYSEVTERKYIGHGRDLAKLTELGKAQAEQVSRDERLKGAEIILASPYTRALQTAAIISKNTGITIEVETDLIEWMPDLTFMYDGPKNFAEIDEEIIKYKGEWNPECKYRWESFSNVGERAYKVIKKYLGYQKVIVVAHGVLMRQFVYMKNVPNCEVITMEFDEESQYSGYVEEGATSLPTKNELAIRPHS